MQAAPLGTPIASGRTAEVYAWGDGAVLKLFFPSVSPADVELERHHASVAGECGVDTPAVYETVRKGNRLGLVYERVDGPTLLEKVQTEPEAMEQWGRLLAESHLSLHRAHVPARLPDQKQRLARKVDACRFLSREERAAVLEVLASLPAGRSLCHGDFHPGNIIIANERPSIIDWVDATVGNPIADVARTSVVLLGHIESGSIDENEKIGVTLFHRTYLHHYMATVPDRWREYEQWLIVAAAARLAEGIAAERSWLVSTVRNGLAKGQ